MKFTKKLFVCMLLIVSLVSVSAVPAFAAQGGFDIVGGGADEGSGDEGSEDSGSEDEGSGDTGSGDTGSEGEGSGGSGSEGEGSGDSGSEGEGSGDSGDEDGKEEETIDPNEGLFTIKTSSKHDRIALVWEPQKDAVAYRVYIKVDGSYVKYKNVLTPSCMVYDLKSATKYDFAVWPLLEVNGVRRWTKNFSEVSETTTKPDGLTASLTVTDRTSRSVTLNWKPVTDCCMFRIFVWKNNGWERVADVSGTTYKLQINSLKPNTPYKFAVRAQLHYGNVWEWAPKFRAVNTSTLLSYVNSVNVAPHKTYTKITYNAVHGAEGYKIYVKVGKNGTWKGLATTSRTQYTTAALVKNVTYYFAVRPYKTLENGKIELGDMNYQQVTKNW